MSSQYSPFGEDWDLYFGPTSSKPKNCRVDEYPDLFFAAGVERRVTYEETAELQPVRHQGLLV